MNRTNRLKHLMFDILKCTHTARGMPWGDAHTRVWRVIHRRNTQYNTHFMLNDVQVFWRDEGLCVHKLSCRLALRTAHVCVCVCVCVCPGGEMTREARACVSDVWKQIQEPPSDGSSINKCAIKRNNRSLTHMIYR